MKLDSTTYFLGGIHQGKYDIAPSDFSVTKARSGVVDFLPTLDEGYMQIFLNNPVNSFNWNAYIEPLRHLCWLAVLLFAVLVPLITAGIMLCGKYLQYRRYTAISLTDNWPFDNLIDSMYTSLQYYYLWFFRSWTLRWQVCLGGSLLFCFKNVINAWPYNGTNPLFKSNSFWNRCFGRNIDVLALGGDADFLSCR